MSDITDLQGFADGLRDQRDKLEGAETVADADREAILQYIRRRDGAVKTSTLETYLRRLRLAAERADQPLVDFDEAAFHEFVFAMRHERGLADTTVKGFEDVLLPFLETVADAEWVEDVERTTIEDTGLDPDDVLAADDIEALIRAASNERDVALIEFLADTGARLSLTLSLRVRDVDLAGERPIYRPNPDAAGLKGAPIQEYPLVDSAAALRSYLRTSHPRPDEPDAALFHQVLPYSRDGDERWDDAGAIRPTTANTQLRRIADRAEIDKPTNPHAFRHAAVSRMIREGYSRSQIEHRVHWSLDSDMWETYEHISGEQHNEDIFRQAGVLDTVETGPDQTRKRCGTCNETLAPHHNWCPNCGAAATARARELADEGKQSILDDLVAATTPEARRELRDVLEALEDNPQTAAAHDEDTSEESD